MNRSRGVRFWMVLAVTAATVVVAGCSGSAGQSSLAALADGAQSDAMTPAPGQVPGSDDAATPDPMAAAAAPSSPPPPPPPPPPEEGELGPGPRGPPRGGKRAAQ